MTWVDVRRLPRHVAVIMDGNGRWARLLGRPRTEGHRQGSHAVRRLVRLSRRLGIQALTLFAFSEQNWARPEGEVSALMDLLEEFIVSEHDEILRTGIRVRAIGRLEKLPSAVRGLLQAIMQETSDLTGMTLTLAVSYGGKEELADAAKTLAQRVAKGELKPDQIDETSLDQELPSMDVGPVDLLIRTGGERRISNFLLWGAAYAELHFSDALWPDFGEQHLFAALADFQARDRRFGLAPTSADSDQLAAASGASDATGDNSDEERSSERGPNYRRAITDDLTRAPSSNGTAVRVNV